MGYSVEEVFKKELCFIKDSNILAFVMECFDELCPEYFWTCPSSSSGKYHPRISLGKVGLVRHVKLAVWWGRWLVEAMEEDVFLKHIPKQQLLDEVTAALLMHDMVKCGLTKMFDKKDPITKKITGYHGILFLKEAKKKNLGLYLNEESRDRILMSIATHMGRWTSDKSFSPFNPQIPVEKQAFLKLVHLADYCASRKVDAEMELIEYHTLDPDDIPF